MARKSIKELILFISSYKKFILERYETSKAIYEHSILIEASEYLLTTELVKLTNYYFITSHGIKLFESALQKIHPIPHGI